MWKGRGNTPASKIACADLGSLTGCGAAKCVRPRYTHTLCSWQTCCGEDVRDLGCLLISSALFFPSLKRTKLLITSHSVIALGDNIFYTILPVCKEDDEENANTAYLCTWACKHRCSQLLVPVSAFKPPSIPVTGKKKPKTTWEEVLIILVPLVQNDVIILLLYIFYSFLSPPLPVTEHCHVKSFHSLFLCGKYKAVVCRM